MINIRNISRFKAAGIHLSISAAIALGSLVTMLALWYPPPYFKAMGGNELILLIVGVDVAIGPLITLIIFDTRKKSLPFDLMVVALLQIAAFTYGIYAMQSGRPVFAVFTGQSLAIVSAADIDPDELAKGHTEEFRHLSLTGPHLVALAPPEDPQELSTLALVSLTGFGIQQLPRYYVPYDEKKVQMLATARPLNTYKPDNHNDEVKLHDYLAKSGRKPAELRYLPVKARHGALLGIIDASSGELLDIL